MVLSPPTPNAPPHSSPREDVAAAPSPRAFPSEIPNPNSEISADLTVLAPSPVHLPTSSPAHPSHADLLSALCDPRLSLLDIARSAKISLNALTLWMARPDVAERLAEMQSAVTLRLRLAAACQLPSAVAALSTIINTFNATRATGSVALGDQPVPGSDAAPKTHEAGPASPSPSPSRSSPAAAGHSITPSLLAIRACNLLLRLANYNPHRAPPTDRPRTVGAAFPPTAVPRADRRALRPMPEGLGEPVCPCDPPATLNHSAPTAPREPDLHPDSPTLTPSPFSAPFNSLTDFSPLPSIGAGPAARLISRSGGQSPSRSGESARAYASGRNSQSRVRPP